MPSATTPSKASPTKTRSAGLWLTTVARMVLCGPCAAMPDRKAAIASAPTTGSSAARTMPPPSAVRTAFGSRTRSSPSRSPDVAASAKASTTLRCTVGSIVNRGLRESMWSRARASQFPTGCGVSAQRRTDLGEREPEQVVQDERRALGRGQRLQDDQHRPRDGVGQADRVGRIGCRLHRLRQPGADIALTPAPRRAQHVQSEAGGRGDQPSGEVVDLVEVAALQADPGFLDHVLGLGHAAEQPVGHADQAWPQGVELGCDGHVSPTDRGCSRLPAWPR